MLRHVVNKFWTSTVFEKLLLAIGVSVGIVGFWLINNLYLYDSRLSWEFLTVVFLWMILIFLIILTDSNENIKEELSIVIREHIEETRILKEELREMKEIAHTIMDAKKGRK